MKGLSDTSPEAERVLIEVYRRMPLERKWRILADLFRFGREMHEAGLRMRRPGVTRGEVRDDWNATHLGLTITAPEGDEHVDQPSENRQVVRDVIAAFESLGITYALGGSIASSIHGITRYTSDADITAEPFAGREQAFADHFGPDYYVSVDAIREAIRERSSFNVINTIIGFKVDVFIEKDREFDRSLIQRRVHYTDPDAPDQPIAVVSAEDIILHKLERYRLGGEVSDRQWSDVTNVLKVQGDRLDGAYLDRWAKDLGVDDLLERARRDAGMGR